MMIYLAYLHFSGAEGRFCNVGEGFSCDVVNQSVYSVVLGVPFAFLGIAYFLGVVGVAALRYDRQALKLLAITSIMFLGPSLYLTGIEVFVIRSICIFCEISKALMVIVAATAILSMLPLKMTKMDTAGAIVFAAVLALVVGVLQGVAATGPRGKYQTFAACLSEAGLRMYGSATCSSCGKQRQMFGDAFELIEELECDPRNPGNHAAECVAKGIDKTPTWILEKPAGHELLRFDAGLQSLEALSEASGCPLVEDR